MATSDRQRGNDIGPNGVRFGDRVRRIRQHLELTQDDLSRLMTTFGRPIPKASIGRIESGDRRVDVDDVMAFARAFDVSPLALLLPFPESPDEQVNLGGTTGTQAFVVWLWGAGIEPLRLDTSNPDREASELGEFRERSRPWWFSVEAGLNESLVKLVQKTPTTPTDNPDHLYESNGR
ncbi:MAG: XRE family transcriptional regulator [Herbiconiux sp.]|uniref:helix-turn-helix domain-containing protein n=1 Tax=Herbiconiux sp. TaxID=1871186 RepID=UPI00121C5CC1|nr:helix-turn-helix transcriptional regulator [Herbiconiux sp.]TAJ46277.1 MAG: XRE family transcriptional regulator [Herbiconiux sp.]